MVINTNVAALTAIEHETETSKKLGQSLEKLSSGLEINKASDDASGLAIADKLRTQASGIKQSIANGNSAVALMQIADKAMGEQSTILDTVKQKLIQAATATTSKSGRDAIAKDVGKLLQQLNNIAAQTNYNGMYLLQYSATSQTSADALTFQMGNLAANTMSTVTGVRANIDGLGLTSLKTYADVGNATLGGIGLSATHARAEMASVDKSLSKMNAWRADFGSTQNQLESAVRNMDSQETNLKAAESVIRDVDYASESATFSEENIIAKAGTYAISQANATQKNVLRLLQ